MAKGTAVFTIDARAAARTARSLRGAPGRIRQAVISVFRGELAGSLRDHFRQAAPYDEEERDPFHLRDHIEVPVSFSGAGVTATVRATAVSPSNGFDYLRVTRYGRGPIVAAPGKYLHWQSGGRDVFAKHVGPYSPGSDWVERGHRAAEGDVADASRTLGRILPTVVLQ